GGKRSLTGVSSREDLICESDVIHLKPGSDYRFDGWVHCISGVAKLGMDFLDEQGHVIFQRTVSPVHVSPGWSYVATEFNSDQAVAEKSQGRSPNTKTLAARVWFRTKGRAEIDDLNLGPASSSFMGNK